MPFRCPRCGIPFSALLSRSKAFACLGCGAIFSDSNTLYDGIQKSVARSLTRHDFLRIGLQGKLNGETVTVTGRIRYRVQCEEWDKEDNLYTQENWSYDEWVLCSSYAEYYLSDYEGELTLQMPMASSPLTRIDWTASSLPLQNGQQARVLVRGIAAMAGMEGEVPWELPDTGTLRVMEYQDGDRTGSVEADVDTDGVAEPEFYLGQPIATNAVRAMFNLSAVIPTVAQAKQKRTGAQATPPSHSHTDDSGGKRTRKSWGIVYLFSGLLLLLTAIMADSSGKMIFSETIDASRWAEQQTVGPVTLDKKGELYEIRISGDVPYSANAAWLSVELETANDEVINIVESDMWREDGESHNSDSQIFQLSEQGSYFLRLYGEQTNLSFPATIQVYEGVTLARYFLYAGGILLLVAAVLLEGKNE